MASEELNSLLRSIRPAYEQLYAGPLHAANYWGIAELAAAKPEDVSSAANVPGPQATTIVAAAVKAERSGTGAAFLGGDGVAAVGEVVKAAAQELRAGMTDAATAFSGALTKLAAVKLSADHKPKPVPMSSVGSTLAKAVMTKLRLKYVDGNKLAPVQVPASTAAVPPFPMHHYPSEPAATPDYVDYLQGAFDQLGVKFGPGGLEFIDVHNNKDLLQLNTDCGEFCGYVDAVAVPYAQVSLDLEMRLAVKLKHMTQDKELYKLGHPSYKKRKANAESNPELDADQANDWEDQEGDQDGEDNDEKQRAPPGSRPSTAVQELDASSYPNRKDPFRLTGKLLGQSVIEVIAVYARAEHPLDLVVTDGHICHILRIRGKQVIHWTSLTPQEAFYHVAASLTEAGYSADLEPPSVVEAGSGYDSLQYLRRFDPLATVEEQIEQLMELDDGSSRVQQALHAVQLAAQQQGAEAISRMAAPPASFYQHMYI